MSDKSESLLSKFASDFGLTIHELLRYAFAGTVGILVMTLALSPLFKLTDIQDSAKTLGSVGLTLSALSIGVVIYVCTRQLLIFPIIYLLNILWPGRLLGKSWSLRQQLLMKECRIGYLDAEVAYFVLRTYREKLNDSEDMPLWSAHVQEQLYRQHSENHLVYSTAFVFAIAAGARVYFSLPFGWYFFWAALFLMCAVLSDAQILRREGTLLCKVGFTKINEILANAGMKPNSATSQGAATPSPTQSNEYVSQTDPP
ncbi:MAG: hypothetical protein JWP89_7009 [Schlesneria sp.]|nr:hypothetical protein [Schlesneria sp.]